MTSSCWVEPVSPTTSEPYRKMDRLEKPGILRRLKTGARVSGALKALTVGALSLTDAAGKEFIIARSEVGTIVAQVRDDLANGA
jgi:hypothetical protein